MRNAAQLTIDGGEVPHEHVVRGPSDSRVLRRPAAHVGPHDGFLSALFEVLDRAKVAPGDAFYVSRLPKPLPVEPAPGKPSKCPQGLPKPGSTRGTVLGVVLAAGGGLRAVVLQRSIDLGLNVASANRRLQELREANLVTESATGHLLPTDRCLALLREAGRER
jgi:hypothetical protein